MTDTAESGRLEPVRYDEEDKYLLRNPREIRQVLDALAEKRVLLTAHAAPRNHSFPSSVIGIAEDEELIYIDGSINETINRSVIEAHHVTCVSQLDRIHIQFRITGLERTEVDGQIAFVAALPEQLLRLQRRDHYRLQVPLTQTMTCEIPLLRAEGRAEYTPLRVLDISGGGLALAVPGDHPDFRPFREYAACRLHLPEGDTLELRMMFKNLFRQMNQNGTESWRAGCQFTELPRGADVQIQRYSFRMERLRSARERGAA